MDKQEFERLAGHITDGTASQQDVEKFNTWFKQHETPEGDWANGELGDQDFFKNNLLDKINAEIAHRENRKVRRLFYRAAAAAILLLALGTGGYLLFRQPGPAADDTQIALSHDIAAGRRQATLTLANGQQVKLAGNLNGLVAMQGKTAIRSGKGQLVYQSGPGAQAITYNTLTTARGEQLPYPVVLADGTTVWLNAQSSLTYPTAFNGAQRVVKLTGEAYFKVKHDPAHPFLVEAGGLKIRDIGTAFNVNAYTDEAAIKTTLFEGTVLVNSTALKPGEQAAAEAGGIRLATVDLEAVGAWVHHDFVFRDQDLRTVMRQIARWYNLDLTYDHAPEGLHIYAKISRDRNLSMVLKAIEETRKVRFKLDGRTLTVTQ